MSRENEREEAAAPSKWGKLKESLLGRKPAAAAPVSASLLPEAAAAELTAGDRKKKGRSGSQQRQRMKGVRARVTAAEYEAIQARARNAGLSTGAYLRACALGDEGPRAKRNPPIHGDALAQAIAALNRVGNNINQIAHHLNAGEHPDRVRIAASGEQLDACLAAISKALGRAE